MHSSDIPTTFVFCALACEARPLIKAWRLKKSGLVAHPFAIYSDAQTVVTITGIGKVAMSGAVAYVMALYSNPDTPVMLNLGIGGHKNLALGTVCLGQKITDADTGKNFFPAQTFTGPSLTKDIVTYSRANNGYFDDAVCDMEASGFYEIAVKFSTSELIQVIKLVSDNTQSSIENINEAAAETWITAQLKRIEALRARLVQARDIIVPAELDAAACNIGSQFHLSVANAVKLRNLMRRWSALRGNIEPGYKDANLRNAGDLIAWLELELEKGDFDL